MTITPSSILNTATYLSLSNKSHFVILYYIADELLNY